TSIEGWSGQHLNSTSPTLVRKRRPGLARGTAVGAASLGVVEDSFIGRSLSFWRASAWSRVPFSSPLLFGCHGVGPGVAVVRRARSLSLAGRCDQRIGNERRANLRASRRALGTPKRVCIYSGCRDDFRAGIPHGECRGTALKKMYGVPFFFSR